MTDNAVSAVLAARLAQQLAPSLALAIWRRGRLELSYLAGDSDGNGTAPRLDTAYRIASCTKSFTAAAILILRERGLLELDAEITDFLPELRIAGPGVPTLQMLLSMSSGLPTDNPWADRQESLSNAQLLQLMRAGIRLAQPPGSGYQYSNLGYALLGQVIQRVSGVSYQEFVHTELLQPLGLSSTGFDSSVPAAGGVARGFRKLGADWQPLPFSAPGEFSAIGGLFSTLEDLGRWGAWLSAAQQDAGPGSVASESFALEPVTLGSVGLDPADRVLSRAARRQMQQVQQVMPFPAADGSALGYGYGLMVQQHPQHGKIVYHSGGYPGFSSQLRWHSDSRTVLVGFENAGYVGVGTVLASLLVDILDGDAGPLNGAGQLDGAGAQDSFGPQDRANGAGPVSPEGFAHRLQPWPETLAARTAVDQLVRHWDDSLARRIFADNVELDASIAERRAELGRLLAQLGPLLEEPGSPGDSSTPAQLEWSIPAARGRLSCQLSMTPLDSPRVQELRFSAQLGFSA